MVRYIAYFDIVNHLGVTVWCDRQTGGQTDRLCYNKCRALLRSAAKSLDRAGGSSAHGRLNLAGYGRLPPGKT